MGFVVLYFFLLIICSDILSSENINFYGIPTLKNSTERNWFVNNVKNVNCLTAIDVDYEQDFSEEDFSLIARNLDEDSLIIGLPCSNRCFPIIVSFKQKIGTLFTYFNKHQFHVCHTTENGNLQIDVIDCDMRINNYGAPIQIVNVITVENEQKEHCITFMMNLYDNLKKGKLRNLQNYFYNDFDTIITSLKKIEDEDIENEKTEEIFIQDILKQQYKIVTYPKSKFFITSYTYKIWEEIGKIKKLTDSHPILEAFFSIRRTVLPFFPKFKEISYCIARSGFFLRNICYWITNKYVLDKAYIFQPRPGTLLTMIAYGAHSAEFETRLYHDLLLDENIPQIGKVYYIETQEIIDKIGGYSSFFDFINTKNKEKIEKQVEI